MSLARQILLDSPLGYWPLDELSGTTAFDQSGNGKHGTYTNGPTLGNKIGQFVCPAFDGSNDYVTIPDAASVFAGATFTVECWFKTTATGWKSFFAKYNSAGNNTKWNLRLTDTNKASMYMDKAVGATQAVSANTVNDGLWHHFLGTFSGGNTGSSYLDGVFQQTSSSSGLYAANVGTQPLTIASYDGTNEQTLCNIAHCAFYSSVLAADRIKAHYEAGVRAGVMVG